jgi:hypothetical protein
MRNLLGYLSCLAPLVALALFAVWLWLLFYFALGPR